MCICLTDLPRQQRSPSPRLCRPNRGPIYYKRFGPSPSKSWATTVLWIWTIQSLRIRWRQTRNLWKPNYWGTVPTLRSNHVRHASKLLDIHSSSRDRYYLHGFKLSGPVLKSGVLDAASWYPMCRLSIDHVSSFISLVFLLSVDPAFGPAESQKIVWHFSFPRSSRLPEAFCSSLVQPFGPFSSKRQTPLTTFSLERRRTRCFWELSSPPGQAYFWPGLPLPVWWYLLYPIWSGNVLLPRA